MGDLFTLVPTKKHSVGTVCPLGFIWNLILNGHEAEKLSD